MVPAHGVAIDTSLPWPEVLRPPANIQGTSSQAHLLVSLMGDKDNGKATKTMTNISLKPAKIQEYYSVIGKFSNHIEGHL